MTQRAGRLRLSAILNDWTTRNVDSFDGVVKVRAVTPEGQHIVLTLSDDQARMVGEDLIRMANGAGLCRTLNGRHELACGCDVVEYDKDEYQHRPDCPIRQTFE